MHDLKQLKLDNNIVDVINRRVSLVKRGSEHYGKCPFHNDTHESLQVNENKQVYKCFVCGDKSGDVIDFMQSYGISWSDIVKELAEKSHIAGDYSGEKKEINRPAIVKWSNAIPQGGSVEIRHYLHGLPSLVWPYRNKDGIIIGYACRFDLPEGKMVLPFTYKTNGEVYEWRWQGFDKPRPLYNLDKLTENPNITAIVLEGEKTADAGTRLISTGISTTWMGGADGIKTADWTPLYGRNVVLWADNDYSHEYGDKHALAGQVKPFREQPGNKAMLAIYEILKDHCPKIKWVKNPAGTPCGWDLADAEWTPEEALKYTKANLGSVPIAKNDIDVDESPVENYEAQREQLNQRSDDHHYENNSDPYHRDNSFFKCLGYEKAENGGQIYYFYAYIAKSVIKLAPTSMSKPNLMQIAPINYWESAFPSKSGVSMDAAQNWLINTCHDVGIFNEKWLRGRGAWIDKKRVVIHAGDHLVVDGRPTHFKDHKSKFIYEIGDELGFNLDNPLPPKVANGLMDVLNLINWDRQINSYLLAGWCVIAPVCGALNWRPHIWLHGGAGTGKSWIFLKIIRPLLGETALAVQGETSEAGLRQTLKHDALPVVFDEAEGNERKDQDRMQSVLALMRQSSATDGGIMAKGTAGGTAKTFRIRSCFAFASINIQIAQQSDQSRITQLGILKHPENSPADTEKKNAQWLNLKAKYDETVTDRFCEGLRARTINLLPVILANARTFSNAAAGVLGEQRTGDQIGALLAGAYSLSSNKEITFDEAVKWITSKDWSEERATGQTRDELSLLAHLLEYITRIETSVGNYERNIGELVQTALGYRSQDLITVDQATERLNRLGIRVDNPREISDPYVYISNSAKTVKQMLEGTVWQKNHNKVLMRIESAAAVHSMRFSSGVSTKAVKILASQIFKSEK